RRLRGPPLVACAGEGEEPSAESLASCEAVRLLGERAASVLPGVAIDDKNAEPVLQLCPRLDAIRLALALSRPRLGRDPAHHRTGPRPVGRIQPRPAQSGVG